jgi:hypothetical protein
VRGAIGVAEGVREQWHDIDRVLRCCGKANASVLWIDERIERGMCPQLHVTGRMKMKARAKKSSHPFSLIKLHK